MPSSSSRFPDLNYDAKINVLKRLKLLSRLLDKVITIPRTSIAIGLDPLMGLIPVGGDVLGLLFSSYIVIEAIRLGIPKNILRKMIFNIIIDTVGGFVPVVGDIFDIAWRANEYNIKLIETHIKNNQL